MKFELRPADKYSSASQFNKTDCSKRDDDLVDIVTNQPQPVCEKKPIPVKMQKTTYRQ